MSKALLIALAAVACIYAGITIRDSVASVFNRAINPALTAAQNVDVKQCRTPSGQVCKFLDAR